MERVRVPRFEAIVELLSNGPRELVDDLPGVDEVERTHALLRDPGGLVEQCEVRLDPARRRRALHLDGDAFPVRQGGAVDLPDRRRSDRPLVEFEKQPVEGQPEILFDDLLDLGKRERSYVVLKAAKLGDDVRREDVRPRGQELPELHERRPQLVEHLAQVLASLRGLAVQLDPRPTSREEIRQPVSVEPVPEPVADRDLRYLRQAPEVTSRWASHGLSLTAADEGLISESRRARGASTGPAA